MAYSEIGRFFSLAPMSARMRTDIENRIQIIGLDLLRSRPGMRFAPSGLRTVLDER
jgi:arginase family enzyme